MYHPGTYNLIKKNMVVSRYNEIMDKQQIVSSLSFKSVDEENLIIYGVVVSDGSTDRHGERINPNGWQLNNYNRNPVILYGHNYGGLPVGKALRTYVEDMKLKQDIQFAEVYDFAVTVFKLMKGKYLNATSVGFIPLEYGESGSDYTWDKCELLEVSVVPVPANPNALQNDAAALAMVKSLEKALKEEEKKKTADESDVSEGADPEGEPTGENPPANQEETAEVEEEETETSEGEKTVTLTETELKALVEKTINEVLTSKSTPEVVEVQDNASVAPELMQQLTKLRDVAKSSDKELGLLLRSLNNVIKTSKGSQ